MAEQTIEEIVDDLLRKQGAFTSGDLARQAGFTRQAVHRHLSRLVQTGVLVREGAGRASHYRRAAARPVVREYPRSGLEEDIVWTEVRDDLTKRARSHDVEEILHYAFTELLNNAIDHSGSDKVTVRIDAAGPRIAFEIEDEGEGAFRHVLAKFGFDNELIALQEISKGKLTTAPERHSGEGLFFVSKAADYFELDSGSLRWIVDNVVGDTAVLAGERPRGTRVRFEVEPDKKLSLADLFARYTEDFQFVRTRTVVKMFAFGTQFVSRSEARRLVNGLEKFKEVILDFEGVAGVGQGFVDEVFRVWARAHPEITLTPVNMNPPVEFMIRRGIAGAGPGPT